MALKFEPTRTVIFPGQGPTELKADPFLGRKILQHVPLSELREAEQTPHPWRYLLNGHYAPACMDLFRAAESVSCAFDRLIRIVWGGATLNCDYMSELNKSQFTGDKDGIAWACEKICRAGLKIEGPFQNPSGDLNEFHGSVIARLKLSVARRIGRSAMKPQPRPTFEQLQKEHRWSLLLISAWLRWGNHGLPGLSYYSDFALAQLLELFKGTNRDDRNCYWGKWRQRLGLEQGFCQRPVVTCVRRVTGTSLIKIQYQGERTMGWELLPEDEHVVIAGTRHYPLK